MLKGTRPLLLATITGTALCSLPAIVQAQQFQAQQPLRPVTGTALVPASSTHNLVPASQGLRPSPQTPHLMPVPSQSTGQNQTTGQGEHQLVLYEAGFMDRVRGTFRPARSTAPVDPGMNYPKAPRTAAPPQAPAAANAQNGGIPSVPPAIPATAGMGSAGGQPALLQPPAGANPIHQPQQMVPVTIQAQSSRSQSTGQNVVQSANIPASPNDIPSLPPTPTVRNVSELKEFLQPESQPVSQSQSQGGNAPSGSVPSMNVAPHIPSLAKELAPGEPTEPSSGAPVAAEADAPPPAPGADLPKMAEAPEKKSSDPFADLFPGGLDIPADPGSITGSPAAMPAAAPVASSTPSESPASESVPSSVPSIEMKPVSAPVADPTAPYTGLTLDSEPLAVPAPVSAPVEKMLPPLTVDSAKARVDNAPAMPAPMPVGERTASKEPATLPTLKTDSLSLEEAPKPAGTATTEITIKPAPSTMEPKPIPVPNVETEETKTAKNNSQPDSAQKSKFERIAARVGQTGLKGFCPVVLRDDRDLLDSRPEFSMTYNGFDYEFSSQDAMQVFASEPLKYAPASSCSDVIHLALTGEQKTGSLDHAVWYKGRLYLFSSVETMETFVAAPSSHASNE